MYSQAELSAIIKEVFLSDVASGQIDLPALIEQALPEVDEATFSGADLVAKTLSQLEANKVFSYNYSNITHATITNEYCKAIVVNGIMHIITLIKIETDEVGVAAYTAFGAYFDVDEDTGSKIFDVEGVPLSEDGSANYVNIACSTAYLGTNTGDFNQGTCRIVLQRLNSNDKNRINVSVRDVPAIAANTTRYLTSRISLTLF